MAEGLPQPPGLGAVTHIIFDREVNRWPAQQPPAKSRFTLATPMKVCRESRDKDNGKRLQPCPIQLGVLDDAQERLVDAVFGVVAVPGAC
jgi:hypothetical protein